MTIEPQAATAPLTVAEADADLKNAKAELASADEQLEDALRHRKKWLEKFKAADRALTAAYLATRQKKGPRKPKAVEVTP